MIMKKSIQLALFTFLLLSRLSGRTARGVSFLDMALLRRPMITAVGIARQNTRSTELNRAKSKFPLLRTARQNARLTAGTLLSSSSSSSWQQQFIFVLRGGSSSSNQFRNIIASSKIYCWILLLTSIAMECIATSLSKRSHDIRSLPLFLAACALYLVCMAGFNVSLAQIPVGVAYAVWSAVGTLIVSTIGIVFFREQFSLFKGLCLVLIVSGVAGLNLIATQS